MATIEKAKMLTCPPAMGFARDQWYVAAFGSEIGRSPLKRTILGERIVMFRTTAGQPVALADRCPHRGLPLSHGVVEGDALRSAITAWPSGRRVPALPSRRRRPSRRA